MEVNLGTLKQKTSVTRTLELDKNIKDVSASCGCTIPSYVHNSLTFQYNSPQLAYDETSRNIKKKINVTFEDGSALSISLKALILP